MIGNTSLNNIKIAIIDALKADAPLMASITGVYENVPQGTAYPYIAIGSMTEVKFNFFGQLGKEATLTLHVWSQHAGSKEALGITDMINAILDGAPLAVTGFYLILCEHEITNTLVDPDGITYHVAVDYRVTVQG